MARKKEIDMFEHFPRSLAAQKKFNTVKVGDTVWMVGGYHHFGGREEAFGMRVRVKEIVASSGYNAGLVLEAPNGELARANAFITLQSMKNWMSSAADEEKNRYLGYLEITEEEKAFLLDPNATAPASQKSAKIDKEKEFDEKMKALNERKDKSEAEAELLQSYVDWKSPKWSKVAKRKSGI